MFGVKMNAQSEGMQLRGRATKKEIKSKWSVGDPMVPLHLFQPYWVNIVILT